MRLDAQNSDPDLQLQQPVKKTLLSSLWRDTHWKCLLLTLLISGCLTAIAGCRLTTIASLATSSIDDDSGHPFYSHVRRSEPRASPCDDGYIYIPVAFVVMLYLVYLVECWHCHTRIQLQYKVDVNTVYDRVHSMRDAMPIVWWKAVCYHYVRRTRQVTRYRNGDTFTSTQVYYERVNSHTASSAFNFTTCGVKDISKTLINLEKYPATKIKFSKGFSFTTPEAEREFEEQRALFFQEHERRDDYMETREGLDFMNTSFREHAIAFANPDHLPWYASQIVFWVGSVLLLSWPLRVLIECKTANVRYHVHKLFGVNYTSSSTCTPGPLSRVSTLASMELEMNIRNNYSIVPSYSEALLMDCGDPITSQRDANSNVNSSTDNGYVPLPRASWHKVNTTPSLLSVNPFSSYVATNDAQRTVATSNELVAEPGDSINETNGPSRSRNVLLHLPSSVRNQLRRKGRRKVTRPRSLADRFLTQSGSEESRPIIQPRRSHSMHSRLAYQTSSLNRVRIVNSVSESRVHSIPSVSSSDVSETEHASDNIDLAEQENVEEISTGAFGINQYSVRNHQPLKRNTVAAVTHSSILYKAPVPIGVAVEAQSSLTSISRSSVSCRPKVEVSARENLAFQSSPSNSPKRNSNEMSVCYSRGPNSQLDSWHGRSAVPSKHCSKCGRVLAPCTHTHALGSPAYSQPNGSNICVSAAEESIQHLSLPVSSLETEVGAASALSRDSSPTPDSPPTYEAALSMTIPLSPVCYIEPLVSRDVSEINIAPCSRFSRLNDLHTDSRSDSLSNRDSAMHMNIVSRPAMDHDNFSVQSSFTTSEAVATWPNRNVPGPDRVFGVQPELYPSRHGSTRAPDPTADVMETPL